MSDVLMRVLANRIAGTPMVDGAANVDNPMLVGFLKKIGIDPAAIIAQAESAKDAVVTKLASIDYKLDEILARQIGIEQRLSDIESNMVVLLADESEEIATSRMLASMNAEHVEQAV